MSLLDRISMLNRSYGSVRRWRWSGWWLRRIFSGVVWGYRRSFGCGDERGRRRYGCEGVVGIGSRRHSDGGGEVRVSNLVTV